jgi:hypothetical protein
MITTSNSPVKGSGIPNQLLGDQLHTIAISGLSRVRIGELIDKVWYNRHQVTREKIELGETKIVARETFPVKDHARRPIQHDVWEGALRSAATVEKNTVWRISAPGMISSGG